MIKHDGSLCGLVGLAGVLIGACSDGREDVGARRVDDFELLAYVDDNADGLSFNDQPRAVQLSDYLARNRPGTKIIMLNAAAGWCGPCMQEASKLGDFAASYSSKGVVVLTAVFQTATGAPADQQFARLWGETFRLGTPILVDTTFKTGTYFDVNTMPANMFVDAESASILRIATGAEPGGDPMRMYRELLDYYLQPR